MMTYEISASTVPESKELRGKMDALPKHYPFEYERLNASVFNVTVQDEDADDFDDFLEDNKISHRSV